MMFFALRKMMLLVLLAMMRCLQITLGEADIISEGNIISETASFAVRQTSFKKLTFVLIDKGEFFVGRGDRTWTCGILLPKQALYQTELRLDVGNKKEAALTYFPGQSPAKYFRHVWA